VLRGDQHQRLDNHQDNEHTPEIHELEHLLNI
jgi:hypothetical protein